MTDSVVCANQAVFPGIRFHRQRTGCKIGVNSGLHLSDRLLVSNAVFGQCDPAPAEHRRVRMRSVHQGIHLVPVGLGIALDLCERLLDYLAEMTSSAQIVDYLVHKGSPCPECADRKNRALCRSIDPLTCIVFVVFLVWYWFRHRDGLIGRLSDLFVVRCGKVY